MKGIFMICGFIVYGCWILWKKVSVVIWRITAELWHKVEVGIWRITDEIEKRKELL